MKKRYDVETALRSTGLTPGALKACVELEIVDPAVLETIKNYNYHTTYLYAQRSHRAIINSCEFLLQNGVCTTDTVYALWSYAPVEVGVEMRRYFNPKQTISICNTDWDIILDRIFRHCQYLHYHARYGFLLHFDNNYLGRDENSIVLYDTTFRPVWRAVLINGEFIFCGNSEILCSQ